MLERPISKAGWTRVRFDQIATQINDRVDNPAEAGVERYVGLEHLDPDSLRIRRWGEPSDVESTKLRFQPGDIIFGKRRVYQRKVAVADFEGICSAHAMVLRAKTGAVLPEFLPFFMQSDLFMERALSISVGSLSPTINWRALAAEEFLLPPIQEQARLVEALSACVAYLNGLETLAASSKSALDSLLKSLSEFGRLTPLGDLVEARLIAPPQDGNHGEKHPKASDYVEDGIPFVMASDLLNGAVDFGRCKKIPRTLADGLRIGFAKRGDVLLSHKGTVGQVARLAEVPADYAMLTPQVTYYRTLDRSQLEPMWLFYCFLSPDFQMQLRRFERQSTRAYVGITAQRELKIPMCEVSGQRDLLMKLEMLSTSQANAAQRRLEGMSLYSRMLGEVVVS